MKEEDFHRLCMDQVQVVWRLAADKSLARSQTLLWSHNLRSLNVMLTQMKGSSWSMLSSLLPLKRTRFSPRTSTYPMVSEPWLPRLAIITLPPRLVTYCLLQKNHLLHLVNLTSLVQYRALGTLRVGHSRSLSRTSKRSKKNWKSCITRLKLLKLTWRREEAAIY